jgi:phosphonate transport system substrate-binding protein
MPMPTFVKLRVLPIVFGVLLSAVSASSQALVFAINEGVTYRVTNDEIRERYAAIAADLSKILQAPVTVEPVAIYRVLRQGLSIRKYDLAMVHPAHISIEAIKFNDYKLLAVIKGYQQYTANFIARADSPLKKLTDLRKKSLGLPDEDSITSWMVRATIRDELGDAKAVKYFYTRYQDAVPFFVEHNLTKAGATAANAVVKEWVEGGGKVFAKSRPVPIKHIIASPSLSPEQVDAVREYLLNLDSTAEGKKKLAPTKYQGFAPFDQAEMMGIGAWLGI